MNGDYNLEGTRLALRLQDLYGIPNHQIWRDDREALVYLEVARVLHGQKSRVFPAATYDRRDVEGGTLHILTVPTPRQPVEVIAHSASHCTREELDATRQGIYRIACNAVLWQLESLELPLQTQQFPGQPEQAPYVHFEGATPNRFYLTKA